MAERMRTSKLDAMISELESLERVDGESETFKRNAIAYRISEAVRGLH